MKYCLFVREDLAQLKDDFFNAPEINGMKSDTYMYKDLKQFLATKNIDLNTQHINTPEECDVIICLNETTHFVNYKRSSTNKLIALILTEPPVYNAIDWTPERLNRFDKIFCYDSDLINQNPNKHVHVNFPIQFDFVSNANLPSEHEFQDKCLASLVAGAISITRGPLKNKSLLFERYKVLKWYNSHAPNSLHFYARVSPLNKFEYFRGASLINRINKQLTKKIAKKLYASSISKVYKGAIPGLNKNDTLGNYKFNFCLENSHGIKGLISEKIFDCFVGKTIPIYYGAPDIAAYIPKNCFIDYSQFKNLKELHNYLTHMNYNTYIQYLNNANNFMENAKTVFSTKTFVEKIYNHTLL